MPRLKIALIVESSRAYGREVLRGVCDYGRVHGPWAFYAQERRLEDQPPTWLTSWDGDGIIARCDEQAVQFLVEQTKFPCVDLRGNLAADLPVVRSDHRLAVETAVEHLRERGFSNIAYCGFSTLGFSQRRREVFESLIERFSCEGLVYESPPPFPGASALEVERHYVMLDPGLGEWLQGLPKPVGILACNDVRGQQLLSTCREIDLVVPEQVAVIGIDNDDVICSLSDPPLTSVDLDAYAAGYKAAELLEQMISGEDHAGEWTLIPPKCIVKRLSTDVTAVSDPDVAKALRFIRNHSNEAIQVEDVVDIVPLSRRALERRFTASIGRTINHQIIQARIERVKDLLQHTDWSLMLIANRCGFRHCEYLSVAFKRHTGITPGQYRAKFHS